jgi:hypothetical protein
MNEEVETSLTSCIYQRIDRYIDPSPFHSLANSSDASRLDSLIVWGEQSEQDQELHRCGPLMPDVSIALLCGLTLTKSCTKDGPM